LFQQIARGGPFGRYFSAQIIAASATPKHNTKIPNPAIIASALGVLIEVALSLRQGAGCRAPSDFLNRLSRDNHVQRPVDLFDKSAKDRLTRLFRLHHRLCLSFGFGRRHFAKFVGAAVLAVTMREDDLLIVGVGVSVTVPGCLTAVWARGVELEVIAVTGSHHSDTHYRLR
jgi:hypothetical protein